MATMVTRSGSTMQRLVVVKCGTPLLLFDGFTSALGSRGGNKWQHNPPENK
jgi:hypothetical protein